MAQGFQRVESAARQLEDIPRQELDAVLCRFFAEIRKKTVANTNQKAWLSCSARWTAILKTVAETTVFCAIVNSQIRGNNLRRESKRIKS